MNYDFSGWATRNDLKCADGRTIRQDAFKSNDGAKVPLVWNHQHHEPDKVLGHAILENRPEGVYAYGCLNETESGKAAKEMIRHGDITGLSIWANNLKQSPTGDVFHGVIREVSLVLAGANPGAYIDYIEHGIDDEGEVFLNIDEAPSLYHADEKEEPKEEPKVAENEKTIKDVVDSMSEEQKNVMYYLIGEAMEKGGSGKEDSEMHHNLFENDENTMAHSISREEVMSAIADVKRYGSMRESFIAHGIEDIEMLFPEAHNLNNPPEFINNDVEWVSGVMSSVHKTPFSRIKSTFADIREDDARALGYLPDHTHRDEKGNLVGPDGKPAYKKEEVFGLLKRTTTPTTIYKKQKFDRDDLIDITDFDFVAWIKAEMRRKLDEEIARAILIGDGRLASSDDKINETNIRPIWKDEKLFTVKEDVIAGQTPDETAKAFIRTVIKSRKKYKGFGNPVLYTTEDMLTDMLLLEDKNGRVIYDTLEKLTTALRVSKIVTVPAMENQTRTRTQQEDGSTDTVTLMALLVNLKDYNVGTDRGGNVTMFDDFDIDYNQQKYLMETRMSGALTKPYSAIAFEMLP